MRSPRLSVCPSVRPSVCPSVAACGCLSLSVSVCPSCSLSSLSLAGSKSNIQHASAMDDYGRMTRKEKRDEPQAKTVARFRVHPCTNFLARAMSKLSSKSSGTDHTAPADNLQDGAIGPGRARTHRHLLGHLLWTRSVCQIVAHRPAERICVSCDTRRTCFLTPFGLHAHLGRQYDVANKLHGTQLRKHLLATSRAWPLISTSRKQSDSNASSGMSGCRSLISKTHCAETPARPSMFNCSTCSNTLMVLPMRNSCIEACPGRPTTTG